jgi:hypothetical protein
MLKYVVISSLMLVGALAGQPIRSFAAPLCSNITVEEYCYPCPPGGVTIAWRGSCETFNREWQCVWQSCGTSPWIPCTCPGESGGCDCLLAGTPINLADGTTKLVETIEVGDRVLSFDESTKSITETEVVAVQEPFIADRYYVINESLRVTHTHPFLSRGRWVDAMNLKVGDRVTGDGSERTVFSIKEVEEEAMAYNFQVANGVYLAAGMVVHNKDICEEFIQYPGIE